MRIDDLINKYFEGETTHQEEMELRRLFATGNVPEEFQIYRPLFAYIDEEAKLYKESSKPKRAFRKYIIYTLSGVAACLAILLGGNTIHKHLRQQPENYVIIDGKRYTDVNLIREQARMAFSDVSLNQDDIFDALFD